MSFPINVRCSAEPTGGNEDEKYLTHWSELHAALMLGGAANLVAGIVSLSALAILAGFSFALLIWQGRRRWTSEQVFGCANWVTLLRLTGILAMLAAAATGLGAVGTAFLLWTLDGLDGWLAKRYRKTSSFGDLFDKETDAFFTLGLTALLYQAIGMPAWILLGGLLRYAFVLILKTGRRKATDLPPLLFARPIGALAMAGLILGLKPMPPIYHGVLAVLTLALGISFLISFWVIFRKSSCPPANR
ncbi:MAG: hypothetical protein Kow0060_14400 [Methylohalobius crimeensis]